MSKITIISIAFFVASLVSLLLQLPGVGLMALIAIALSTVPLYVYANRLRKSIMAHISLSTKSEPLSQTDKAGFIFQSALAALFVGNFFYIQLLPGANIDIYFGAILALAAVAYNNFKGGLSRAQLIEICFVAFVVLGLSFFVKRSTIYHHRHLAGIESIKHFDTYEHAAVACDYEQYGFLLLQENDTVSARKAHENAIAHAAAISDSAKSIIEKNTPFFDGKGGAFSYEDWFDLLNAQ